MIDLERRVQHDHFDEDEAGLGTEVMTEEMVLRHVEKLLIEYTTRVTERDTISMNQGMC